MKKSIISRMKSKKNQLAAGVLAIILGMFPGSAEAQFTDVYNVNINIAEGTHWYGAYGYNNQNPSSTSPGHYISDGSGSYNYRMVWNYGGGIRVSTYQGDQGDYGRGRRPTLGGHSYIYAGVENYRTTYASTMVFRNYSTRTENGGVILVTNGDYGIYGEHTNNVISSWRIENNSYVVTRTSGTWWNSYVYFKNNEALNGGAIAVTNGELDLLRVILGDNRALRTTGTSGLGGALFNDRDGVVNLNGVHFGAYNGTGLYDPLYAEAFQAIYGAGWQDVYDQTYLQLSTQALADIAAAYDPVTGSEPPRYEKGGDRDAYTPAYDAEYKRAVEAGYSDLVARNLADAVGRAAVTTAISNARTGDTDSALIVADTDARAAADRASEDNYGAAVTAGLRAATYGGNTAWRGGAIHNTGTIRTGESWDGNGVYRNSFTLNSATQSGGAIYNEASGTINIGAEFHYNTAIVSGGAVYNRGTFSLGSGSRFENNTVTDAEGLGGAIYNETNGTVNLTGTFFSENYAGTLGTAPIFDPPKLSGITGLGGAIYNRGTLNLNSVTFEKNTARKGGAIYNLANLSSSGATAFMTNYAAEDGGAIYFEGGTSSFSGTSFTRNVAGREGGAIYNNGATIVLGNAAFSDNRAVVNGGAVYNYNGPMTFNTASFTDNYAGGYGGAIVNYIDKPDTVMTIQKGSFERNNVGSAGGAVPMDGGAIYNMKGTMAISDIYASENLANWGYGGAIYNARSGSITITSSYTSPPRENFNSFTRNNAISGGAIYNAQQTYFSLDFGSFDQNTAVPQVIGVGGLGGAIYNEQRGTFVLNTGFFTANTALSGGAIYNDAGTKNQGSMTLSNAEFMDNKALGTTQADGYGYGGAIYNAKDALLNLDVYSSFTTNVSNRDGGAIYNDGAQYDVSGNMEKAGGVLNITNGNFLNNQSSMNGGGIANHGTTTINTGTFTQHSVVGAGGAIYNAVDVYNSVTGVIERQGGLLTVNNGRFEENRADRGGAVYNAQRGFETEGLIEKDLVQFNNGTFNGNSATEGGAIYNDVDGRITVSGMDFTWNTADRGGAIYNNGGIVTLTDVTFTDNKTKNPVVGLPQQGGAVYNNLGTLNLNVVGKNSVFGRDIPIHVEEGTDNIYFNGGVVGGDVNVFNVNVASTAYSLTMKGGGMASADGAVVDIFKTGIGTWRFEGKSQFGTDAVVNFDLLEGTLALAPLAVLDLGTYGDITTYAGSSIDARTATFALSHSPDTSDLGYGEARIAAQQLVVKGSTEIFASAFNFKAGSEINFEEVTANATQSGEGPFLTLTLDNITTADAITVGSDIYVEMPTVSLENGGYIVLFETNGIFNGTSGDLYVGGNKVAPFERMEPSPDNTEYLGLAVGEEWKDYQQIVLTMVDASAKSVDLTWSGVTDDIWKHFDKTKQNWSGTVAGHYVDIFMNNDDVFFHNTYIDSNRVQHDVVRKDVVISPDDVTVGSMTVTGDDYTFDLTAGTITAGKNIDFGTAGIINATAGRTVTAGTPTYAGTINFAGKNDFTFNLRDADNDAFLSFAATGGVTGTVGDGKIDVSNVTLTTGGKIILIDTGSSTVVTNIGTLYENGTQVIFQRDPSSNVEKLGLIVQDANGEVVSNGTGTQLVLTKVKQNDLCLDLHWTGATGSGTWNVNAATNWLGTVGGHRVDTFLNGDSVIFANEHREGTVTVKAVTLAQSVTVGDMTVTGSDYSFNLSNGNITATGSIDFGSATLIVSSVGAVVKAGTPTADGTITFNGGNDFHFGLAGASDGDTMLTLDASGVAFGPDSSIGPGNVYVSNANLGENQKIILIDALLSGVFTNVGKLLDGNGEPIEFDRDTAHIEKLGLTTNDIQSQLLLTMIYTDDVCKDLVWSGIGGSNEWDVNTTRNWAGSVGGHYVDKFLNGDTVTFAETYVGRDGIESSVEQRDVKVVAGGVTVEKMTVSGDGYTFDLSAGGITSNTSIDFGTASVSGISAASSINTVSHDTGDINFTDGSIEFGESGEINAGRDINIGTAKISGFTVDGTIYATRDINIGDGNIDLARVATIGAGRDINFGSTNLKGMAGNAIKAGGNISFGVVPEGGGPLAGAGTLEFGASTTIAATGGNINFADATLGSENAAIVVGTMVNAGGTIAFAGGNDFHFDLSNAFDGSTFLDLNAAGVTGLLGDKGIYVWNTNLSVDESVILIDAGIGGTVDNTGKLYKDGEEVKFSRDDDPGKTVLGLRTNETNSQLLLTMIQADAASTDLTWTGKNNDGVWDVNGATNWKGTVAGFPVETFLNGDSVTFENEYLDDNNDPVTVTNKTITVVKGGVKVGDMSVGGDDYSFNLSSGGITAAGDIDFGNATLKNLFAGVDAGTVTAGGSITFVGGTIGLTVGRPGDDAIISAGNDISILNTTLTVDGYNGKYGDDPILIVHAGGTLTGFDKELVLYDKEFFYARAYKDGNDILVESTLYWYSENPEKANGTFTIDGDETFTVGTDLEDRPPADHWGGTDLTKKGDGTLILTGNNTYTGGSTIDGGKLVAGHVNAVGTGPVTINGAYTFEVAANGTFTNVIHGANAGSEVIFGSSANDKLTVKPGVDENGLSTDYAGKTTISSGTVRLESLNATGLNDASKEVAINGGATLELAFGIEGLNPWSSKNDTRNAEYRKRLTGDGGVTIDGGLVVLANTSEATNTRNNYTGPTNVVNGTLIIDGNSAIGDTSVVNLKDGNFTLGFAGNFSKTINGDGNVYINPDRNGGGTTILSGNNDYTGNTIVYSGVLKLANIKGTGRNNNENDHGGDIELRNGTVLELAVGGDYYKRITDNNEGTGSVLKTESGKISLYGKNNYGGGTTIQGGELVARHTEAVGSGRVTLEGGVFSVLVDASQSGNNTFGNEIVTVDNAIDKTVKFGTTAGTLLLGTPSNYAAATVITQGTVNLTHLGATGRNDGAYSVEIAEDATLIISAVGTYNKKIFGEGTLEKNSAETLTLTGNNSQFTGTLLLSNGNTVLDHANALAGSPLVIMKEDTSLTFKHSMDTGSNFTLVDGKATMDTANGVDVTLTGLIDGNGWLDKRGAGTLTLENANNSFTRLDINAGKLVASNQNALGNGKITNNATLELNVATDVTLRSDLYSDNGTFVKSGDGKLNIGLREFKADKFVMNGGSLEVQLSVGDKYAVHAGSFEETKSSEIIGTYNSNTGLNRGEDRAVRFLALDGAGSGLFSNYTFNSNVARVNGREVIDGNQLFFEAWLDSFIDAYGDGLSQNAWCAADAADRLAEDNPLMQILTAYENEGGDMKKAFTALHGEVYMSSIYATADLQRNFDELVQNRRLFCEHCREFNAFRGQNAPSVQREVWATFTGGGNFRTAFDRFSGYNIGRWGIAGGMEHNYARGLFGGIALGYDQADLDMTDLPQKDQFHAFRVSAYGNYTIDDVSMFAYIGYSKNWHDVERKIDFLGVNSQAKYNDDVLTMGFDISKTYHVQNTNIIPSIGFTCINLRTPFIEESGAEEANLYVKKKRYESFRVPLGVRFNSKFNIQGVDFQPEVRAFYTHEFSDHKVRGVTAFASDGSNTFLVDSGVRGRGSFRLGLGMQAQLFDFLSVGADYNAEVWRKYTRHDVGGNVKLRW